MPSTQKKVESTELTVQERADQALTIEHTEKDLVELAGKPADIAEIKDNADYELVKRGALVLRDVRVQIEKAGKAARDDANLFSKAVIAKQKDLIGLIAPEETRLKDLRREVDEAAETRQEEIRQAEVNRITDIERRIQAIGKLSEGLLNADADGIKARIEAVEEIQTTVEYFAEFAPQAAEAREDVAEALAAALVARVDLEAQQEAQARVAAEQKAQQEALDAQAEKLRLAQEAIDQEKRDAEEKLRREEEDRQEAIRQKERAKAEEDRKERERLEKIEAKRVAEEERVAEEARQKALLPAKEKLQAWAEEIKNMEGPKVRDKNQQKIVSEALAALGAVGNLIHARVKEL